MIKWLEENTPKLVLAPSFIAVLIFVYGFIAWTAWVSLTRSRLLPKYEIEGFIQYERLFACLLYTSPSPRDRQKSRMPSSA